MEPSRVPEIIPGVKWDLQIVPQGEFSLQAAAGFGFGPTEGRPPPFDGCLRLAFAVDGGGHAGAVMRQPDPDGPVDVALTLRHHADPDAALAQVARVLSLDHDGEGFAEVGRRDPVIGALQRAHPGQRPVLFHSPYEAAAWAIISARRSSAQGARVRDALAQELGESFALAQRTLHAFPQPDRLAELDPAFPGLGEVKVERLRALALVALDGALDVARLQALGPEAAYVDLQSLSGIGPFYAGLITLRGTGFADAMLMAPEPKVLAHAGRLYERGEPLDLAALTALAQRWRPYRTWATVLLRLAGERGAPVRR